MKSVTCSKDRYVDIVRLEKVEKVGEELPAPSFAQFQPSLHRLNY